jgi:hypothetical protein
MYSVSLGRILIFSSLLHEYLHCQSGSYVLQEAQRNVIFKAHDIKQDVYWYVPVHAQGCPVRFI